MSRSWKATEMMTCVFFFSRCSFPLLIMLLKGKGSESSWGLSVMP